MVKTLVVSMVNVGESCKAYILPERKPIQTPNASEDYMKKKEQYVFRPSNLSAIPT